MLAVSEVFRLAGLIETGIEPGCLVTFEQKGAGSAAKRVSMYLKQAVLVLAKDKCEGIKHFIRAQPDVFGFARLYGWPKKVRICPARYAVNAIGGDQQVIGGKLREVVHLATKLQADA